MVDQKGLPRNSQVRKLETFVKKLSDEEINTFLVVLGALMAQVPAPRDARKSYLREVERRLRNNGADFLSKSRVFPTFGLKLLGNDLEGFPIQGFKQQQGKKYPHLFAWYWSELERLSSIRKPSKIDTSTARKVLTVLSFSKMIKMSSVNQIKKSLRDFESRVDTPLKVPKNKSKSKDIDVRASDSENATGEAISKADLFVDSPEKLFFRDGPDLSTVLGIDIDLEALPKYLDLGSLSTKPSALKERPAFPNWFKTQFYGGIQRAVREARGEVVEQPLFGFKGPPYGRVHVLTEGAGKLRLIVPYNTPFVHSTGLYGRCRAFMRALPQDCSDNQAVGHRYVCRGTTRRDGWNISADLSNFTDDIHPEAITFGLRYLGLADLSKYLLKLPISLPCGRIITPCKLLMGLKGCFELSSLLHHYVVQRAGIKNYTLCGDDIYFRGDIEKYLVAIKHSGWSINRSKTVYSKTVAVFCGEMYWLGSRISPRVPKVSSCFSNGKLASASVLFSVTRDSIESLNNIFSRRGVARVIEPIYRLLRIRWPAAIFPELPAKLRGLGMRINQPSNGLIKLLEKKCALKCALLSIGYVNEKRAQHRWFGIPIELTPNDIQREYPDFPALLTRGAVKLTVPRTRKNAHKDISMLDR
jgi:hypothetical protein